MIQLKQLIWITRFMEAMSLFLLFLSGLALMDIGDGREPNLMLEWIMVWLTVPWVFISILLALFTSFAAGRKMKRLESENRKLRNLDANG